MNTSKIEALIVCVVLILQVSITEQCAVNIYGLKLDLFKVWRNQRRAQKVIEVAEPTLQERFPGYDQEAYMDAQELIESKGIPYEGHTVTTEDGYILGLQRLARPNATQQYPVLLIHGVMSSSESFLLNLRYQSLAYVLYDRGFDVWLGNVRGTKYSRNHTNLDPDTKEFWDWSFDEMGKYDIPVMIDHVLEVTGRSKLNYIGHSQGAMVLFSSVIQHQWWYQSKSQIGDKIANFFALAPAVYIEHAWSWFMKDVLYYVDVGENYADPLWNAMESSMSHDEFAPIIPDIVVRACHALPLTCMPTLDDLSGRLAYFNTSRLGVYLLHEPSGTSTKNMRHWIQMSRRSNNITGMKYYEDDDWTTNFKRYWKFNSPAYNFNRFFGVKTFIYCGEYDAMVTVEDCQRLRDIVDVPNQGENVRVRVVDYFSHFDFAYSTEASKYVYEDIIRNIMGRDAYVGPPPIPMLPGELVIPKEFVVRNNTKAEKPHKRKHRGNKNRRPKGRRSGEKKRQRN